MTDHRWTEVDRFFEETLLPPDPVFAETLAAAEAAGLPPISVSAPQGMLLHLLVRLSASRRILEIGTLAGYSTIWMARALGGVGSLVTLELEPRHAEVARANLARAGVADVVDLRVGPALDSLARLEAEGTAPFGLVFVDADKQTYPDYVRWALRLTVPGSVIVVDNVVREGRVADPTEGDPVVAGTRSALEIIGAEPRLSATAIQTVGSKGYDGFAVALVTG